MYSLFEEGQFDRLRFELDWLFAAEQDCDDKERFRSSLVNKLLEKKEQREDIQTFVNHMKGSNRNRGKMWSFIAYEFGPEYMEFLCTNIEWFVTAAKECENAERFRRVLAHKLLDKKEQGPEIQDFIKNIESSIENREKMRIFIAYYFDAQRYQDYPEQCLRQARLMINAPEPTAPKIDENNFYLSTYAEFQKKQPSDLPQKAPDYISYAYSYDRDEDAERYIRRLTDRISSEYWYTEEGVFRRSDHRGPRIRRCSWELVDLDSSQQDDEYEEQDGRIQVGFCSRKNFEDKRNFSLSDDLYWETGDEKQLPTIPLEFLGKEVKTFEFDEVGWSQIQDLGAPLDDHPNHYADDITLLIGQEAD